MHDMDRQPNCSIIIIYSRSSDEGRERRMEGEEMEAQGKGFLLLIYLLVCMSAEE